ncbi:MAG: hypothetical protein HY735_32410 [Verrucomicrobia bacterium]|nr:hypothetical protein [Verrucomicrobiota bacterium]
MLIDLQQPERIRVISETAKGSVVSDDLTTCQPAGKFVVQAALGIQGRRNWPVAEQNLVILGAEEYWILTELSHMFRKAGRDGLPPDVLVTPAGGAAELTYLAAFMAGQGQEVLALYENDPASRAAREALVNRWLPKYPGQKVATLDMAEAIGNPAQDCSIEDLFPEAFYLARVQKTYENHLPAAALSLSALPPGPPLAKRVEIALRSANVTFDKRAVGKRVAADIRQMRNMIDLPEQTRLLGEKLFASIKKAFAKQC